MHQKKYKHVISVLLCVLSMLMVGDTFAASQDQMRVVVERLVEAARNRTTLWPWEKPDPEVAAVAEYGKEIAPLLVNLLADDPDDPDESTPEIDWNIQQQAALALCKIYGISEEGGHVYMNRASREENASVKRFWVKKVGMQ